MTLARAIPVSRRQDHGNSADNSGMFDATFTALGRGDLLAIYPEGESVPEPRLGSLRTGAARIALGALARGTDVTVLPMGLHYFDVSVLRGRAFVDVGAGLLMSDVVSNLGHQGPVSESDADLVHAVTAVFERHLGAVVDEYDGWLQRRRYELAASVYLRNQVEDASEPISYERIADVASAIARAPEPLREQVDVELPALESVLELLGVDGDQLSRATLTGTRMAAQGGLVALLVLPGIYGAIANAIPMGLLRAVSMSGMAPATAATVKPAVALTTFPAVWAGAAWLGHHVGGTRGAVAMGIAGPLSLAATVGLAERLELMWLLGRALRRYRGPAVQQVRDTRSRVVASVAEALEAAPATAPEYA